MAADDAAAQRAKVGCVFENQGWISFLDVGQNITLAQRHHSTRTDADIEEEATRLARLFGLPGLPHWPVSGSRQEDLNRAAFIRAFLGHPALIILERPTRELLPGILPPLINAVRMARDQGSAIIWTTSEDLVWNNPDIHATLKCTMFGSRMNVVEEDEIMAERFKFRYVNEFIGASSSWLLLWRPFLFSSLREAKNGSSEITS